MKYVALTCALLLGGCALHKPTSSSTAPGPEPVGADALPRDSTTALHRQVDGLGVEPHYPLLGKLLGWTPKRTQLAQFGHAVQPVPRKCKGCVFNVVAGDQTNTSADKKAQVAAGAGAMLTSIEKPRAAVAAAPGAVAQDYRKQGQRGGAAASGAGATATATTSKGFPWWLLLIPTVGYAVYRVNKRFTIF